MLAGLLLLQRRTETGVGREKRRQAAGLVLGKASPRKSPGRESLLRKVLGQLLLRQEAPGFGIGRIVLQEIENGRLAADCSASVQERISMAGLG